MATQLKILIPVGTAIESSNPAKKMSGGPAHADREHVVRPHAEADEADRNGRGRHRFVAEDHLARKDRNHFRDHAEGRQDQDVDLGMAEEPEQVLP